MNEQKKLYRYVIEYGSYEEETRVVLREYKVIRETGCKYVIQDPRMGWGYEKKVDKTAHTTFAYDTKEKAMENFLLRTTHRIRWYEYWLEECKKGLEIAEGMTNA